MKKLTQKEWLSCNFFVPPRKKSWLGGGRFQIFLECSPRKLGKMNPNLTCAYFSDGLKLNHQPVEPFLCHASQRLCWVRKNQNWGYLRYALGLPSYGVLVPKRNEGHATQDGHAVFSSKMPKRNALQEKLTYPPDVWHIWVDDFPNFPRWDMLISWRVDLRVGCGLPWHTYRKVLKRRLWIIFLSFLWGRDNLWGCCGSPLTMDQNFVSIPLWPSAFEQLFEWFYAGYLPELGYFMLLI